MKHCTALLLWLCIAVAVAQSVASSNTCDSIVTTDLGQLQGVCEEDYRIFLGVYYAATTGGDNRWKSPQPLTPWTGVKNATEFTPGCEQTDHNPDVPPDQAENCLSLNVWTPVSATGQSKLPVMVFLHGGAFKEGGSSLFFYNSSYSVTHQEVVVVTINYRLGALGFLVTDELEGNFGLMDQRAALQWVQRNIAAFGGDPNHVVIWGESAGAMSIGIHMISPLSKGLFHYAIMESNPAAFQYKTVDRAKDYGRKFADVLNCSASDTACLRSKSIVDVLHASNIAAGDAWTFIIANLPHILDGFLQWTPTVSGDQLPSQVIPAFAKGEFQSNVPLLIGSNQNEGATFVMSGVEKPMPEWEYAGALAGIFGAIHGYKIEAADEGDYRKPLGRMLTDYWFRCASRRLALDNTQLGNAPSYIYRFAHVLSFNPFVLKQCANITCHAAEIPFVFHSFGNFTPSAAEELLSANMIDYWSNFATTANPNTGTQQQQQQLPVQWPVYTEATQQHIYFVNTPGVESDLNYPQCDFWDKIGYDH